MTSIPFIYQSKENVSQLKYVLHFLNQHPLCSRSISFEAISKEESNKSTQPTTGIHYSKSFNPTLTSHFIPAQNLIFSNNIQKTASLSANCYTWKGIKLYSVENHNKETHPFFKNNKFSFDLIETIFFHISRYEEYHCTEADWDKYDMMQEQKQFLVCHQIHQIPVVDQLVYCFFQAMGLLPKKVPTIYQLSHDIDSVWKLPSFYKLARASARLLLENKGVPDVFRLTKRFWNVKKGKTKDPHDVFDWFLCPHQEIKKVIYLMAGGKTRYEGFYDIEDPYLLQIIEKAKEIGYEIGLHPSYLTWQVGNIFQQELKKLEGIVGRAIVHSRQHFLHYSFQKSPTILEKVGIQNDSTWGYQNLIGFRSGTGFDYQPYHFREERACSFWETPLVVMDCALLAEQDYDIEKAETALHQFLNNNQWFTKITFNFHNHIFDDMASHGGGMRKIYEQLFMDGG